MAKLLAIMVLLACPLLAHSEQLVLNTESTAEKTLNHYLQLRLRDADWKDYSEFITWPDEPSWDCKWVAERYEIWQSIGPENGRIIIPVVFKRLGLFCYDFQFSTNAKEEKIDFTLIKSPNGWKIDAPIPDYPYILADILMKSLAVSAENLRETSDRRAQFAATLRKVSDSLAHNK